MTARPDKHGTSCHFEGMNTEEIIARLRENEPTLRARGVSHAALFGSRARGDNRPDSDIDIMIEFDPAARVTVFNYAGLKDYIAGLFDVPVDVINREGLKPYVQSGCHDRRYLCFLAPQAPRCATSRITSTSPPALWRDFGYDTFLADPRTVYAVTRAVLKSSQKHHAVCRTTSRLGTHQLHGRTWPARATFTAMTMKM